MVEDLSVLNNVAEIWLTNNEWISQDEDILSYLIADLTQLLKDVYNAGYSEGHEKGIAAGYEEGLEENLTELQW